MTLMKGMLRIMGMTGIMEMMRMIGMTGGDNWYDVVTGMIFSALPSWQEEQHDEWSILGRVPGAG